MSSVRTSLKPSCCVMDELEVWKLFFLLILKRRGVAFLKIWRYGLSFQGSGEAWTSLLMCVRFLAEGWISGYFLFLLRNDWSDPESIFWGMRWVGDAYFKGTSSVTAGTLEVTTSHPPAGKHVQQSDERFPAGSVSAAELHKSPNQRERDRERAAAPDVISVSVQSLKLLKRPVKDSSSGLLSSETEERRRKLSNHRV